jgi:hypothetical protein
MQAVIVTKTGWQILQRFGFAVSGCAGLWVRLRNLSVFEDVHASGTDSNCLCFGGKSQLAVVPECAAEVQQLLRSVDVCPVSCCFDPRSGCVLPTKGRVWRQSAGYAKAVCVNAGAQSDCWVFDVSSSGMLPTGERKMLCPVKSQKFVRSGSV